MAEQTPEKKKSAAAAAPEAAPKKQTAKPAEKTKPASKPKTAAKTTGKGKSKAKTKTAGTAGAAEAGAADSTAAESTAAKLQAATKKIGKRAKETGEGLKEMQDKVKTEIGPAVEKAGKGLKEAKQTLGDVLKATARATRKSARILGIKANIANQTRIRQKLFAQLGEQYYKTQKKKAATKSDEQALEAIVEEINQVGKKIRDLEAQEREARVSS